LPSNQIPPDQFKLSFTLPSFTCHIHTIKLQSLD
jgi:hypothetical protein